MVYSLICCYYQVEVVRRLTSGPCSNCGGAAGLGGAGLLGVGWAGPGGAWVYGCWLGGGW